MRLSECSVSAALIGLLLAACGQSSKDAEGAAGSGRGGASSGVGGAAGRAGADVGGGAGSAGRPSTGGSSSKGGGTGGSSDAGSGGASNEAGTGDISAGAGAGESGDTGSGGVSQAGAGGSGTTGVVCEGDVSISNDSDLVAFAARGCETLEGSLTISSSTLRSLEALSPGKLRVITGDLNLNLNPQLLDLGGLAGLTRIEGSLLLGQNTLITDLEGLGSLTQIGSDPSLDYLAVYDNTLLENVEALANVTQFLVSLFVNANPSLTSLRGIDSLRSVGFIELYENFVLREFGGLAKLEACGTITAYDNNTLETFDLPALKTCDRLDITSNAALVSLSLPALTDVTGTFYVWSNINLTTLGPLDALTHAGSLSISDNQRLPQCEVDTLDLRLQACEQCTDNDPSAICD